MNKQTEALKMAIEAMERAEEIDWELNSLHVLNILQAIKACKEALAQPAQEHICGDRPAIADRQVTLQSNNIVRDKQGTIIGHLVKSRDELIEKAREEGRELERRKQPAQEPLYFALTKDHTWLSITEQQYDKLNPDYRMKVCTYENT